MDEGTAALLNGYGSGYGGHEKALRFARRAYFVLRELVGATGFEPATS